MAWAKVHQPCPCGQSSDAFSIRTDGSGFCFSCNKNKNLMTTESLPSESGSGVIEYDYLSHRKIPESVFRIYDVKTKFQDGDPVSVAFPYGDSVKVRHLADKKFTVIGGFKDAGLFGQDKFDPGSKDAVVVTEGEFDALAVYSMLRGEVAAVSIKSGVGSAYRDLVNSYEYLNSFKKIYLCFDNDAPGQDAVKAIQGLFDFNKVYHVRYHKYKDASEYSERGAQDDFVGAFKSAKRFVPDNIIHAFGDIAAALEDSSEDCLGTYPFDLLNNRLFGLYAGEVIVVKAPEGVGKTEFCRALEYHLLQSTEHPIGIIHLEEDNATTIKAVAGYHLEIPAVLPDCGLSRQDILDAYRKAVRDDEGRIHIHSSFDVEDEQAFLGNIRFLVSAAGCRFIFLDHISWLATGLADEDERRKLDRISQKLKLLAKELRFCLVEISHVNDDGKTRGSRNVSKVANTVISLDRDLTGGETYMSFMIEKARLGGRTGPAGGAWFDRYKGKLTAEKPIIQIGDEDNGDLP